MGIILSKLYKQPTTLEKLKKIEDALRKIEDYKRTTEKKQKRTIANIVIYGVALYMLACVIVFVWFLPETWLVRLALLVPLVLVPLIIYWMKRLISNYFDSKMVKANEEYVDLERKKKELIDSIMETETFNKAKEILSRYAPEKLGKKEPLVTSQQGSAIIKTAELRNRKPLSANASGKQSYWKEPNNSSPESGTELVPSPRAESVLAPRFSNSVTQMILPQPLFPKDRSFGDKLVEYIIGDGPAYRYALICKYCREHNGMALQEEFPYMSYTCCYCRKFNPARITRPSAPPLPETVNLRGIAPLAKSIHTIASAGRNLDVTKTIPFDNFYYKEAQGDHDTEYNVGTDQKNRISDADASEHLEENEDILSKPKRNCENASEDEEDDVPSGSVDDFSWDFNEQITENGNKSEILPTETSTKLEKEEFGGDNASGNGVSKNG